MWEAIAGAAASLIGSWLSSKNAGKSQDAANQANINLNKENRDWMTEMSSTSYQRGVKDMEAAGLSPMLAYSQGGASTPTSAAPVVSPVMKGMQGVGEGIAKGSASAAQAAQIASTFQQIDQSKDQQALLRAQADKARSETMDRDLNTAQLIANTDWSRNRAAEVYEQILGTRYSAMDAIRRYDANQQDPNESDALKRSGWWADVQRRKAEASRMGHESRRSSHEADIAGYERSKAGAESRMYDRMGGDAIPYISPLMDMIGGVSSARRAFGGSRHRSTFEVIKP